VIRLDVASERYNSGVSAPAVLVPPPGRHEKKRGLPMRAQSSEHAHGGCPPKSLASGRRSSAYPLDADCGERISERTQGTARRRTADASRSGACRALLAPNAEARLYLWRPSGVPASGRAQRSTSATRGRGVLPRGARCRNEHAKADVARAVRALATGCARSAQPYSHQGRASMTSTAGSAER
jgi:hypothetical protein